MADDKFGKEIWTSKGTTVGDDVLSASVFEARSKKKIQLTRTTDDGEFRKLGRLTLGEAKVILEKLTESVQYLESNP